MDEISVIESAESGLRILTPTLQHIVIVLVSTLFSRGGARSREIEKLKNATFNDIAKDLLKSGDLTHLEYYKCNNFLKIAEIADEIVRNSKSKEYNEDKFDFDWFMRFFDSVGDISNEDLHGLWGKILAGETKARGACSLRTLSLLRNMNSDEAKLFQKLTPFVIVSGRAYFIFNEGFMEEGNAACHLIVNNNGLVYQDHIRLMIDCGLITDDTVDIATHFNEPTPLHLHNSEIIAIIASKRPLKIPFVIGAYNLSSSGIELFKILQNDPDFRPNADYTLACLRHIRDTNPKITITAHKMLYIDSDNQPQFDQNDLL